jgi:hypothetical protein
MELSVSDWSTEHKISYLPSINARERSVCQASESTHTACDNGALSDVLNNAQWVGPMGAMLDEAEIAAHTAAAAHP